MDGNIKKRITVLGAGTWGSTLAGLLADKSFPVRLWDVSGEVMDTLLETRTPPKLPHLRLPEGVELTRQLEEAVGNAELLVIVTPSHAVRNLCMRLSEIKSSLPQNVDYVLCSKGLEQKTLMTLNQVMEDVLGPEVHDRICCLSGPSHAEEVSKKMPTSITASSFNHDLAVEVQKIFHTHFFRVYTHKDVLGVELGGSVKNVIAIAAGICDGLGFRDNTKAALITRGLAEIIRLGEAMGASRETFSGLAGIGDLIVTAMSKHSRNRNFGELLAKDITVQEAMDQIGMVVEGVRTADSVKSLAEKYDVQMPISMEIYRLIYEEKDPKEAVKDLMGRSPKPEIYGPHEF